MTPQNKIYIQNVCRPTKAMAVKFFAFTKQFSQLFTTGVREHQSNVTCFSLVRSHQTCILDGYMRGGWPWTHDLALNGWTRKAHQLGRQIACGATVGSEAYEKLEVKAKADG